MKFIIKKLNNFEEIVMRYKVSILVLSTLLATSPMAQSSDMPIREKRATEEQQSKYRTMTGLENFAGKIPKDITLSYLLRNGIKHDSSHLLRTRLLLVGKHGVGKTLLVKELAKIMDIPLLPLDISTLHIEEGKNCLSLVVERVFKQAKDITTQENKCVIVLLDNIDVIGKYAKPSDISQGWGSLQRGLDSVDDNVKVIILATAHPDHCTPKDIISRIGCREILVPLPDFESRQDIFKYHLSKYDAHEKINLSNKFIKNYIGFTGADIERVVKEASMVADLEKAIFLLEAKINTIICHNFFKNFE